MPYHRDLRIFSRKRHDSACKLILSVVGAVRGCAERAVVVYKQDQVGVRTLEGLGVSQLKELEYLELAFPKYSKQGGFKEIDAREFAQIYAVNRGQMYTSATDAIVDTWADNLTWISLLYARYCTRLRAYDLNRTRSRGENLVLSSLVLVSPRLI